jgi:hydrogenase maturation protease
MSPILVLGIGNVLMGDEGVGVHAVRTLEHEAWPDHVACLDGGTGGFHLLEFLQDAEWIILIDATVDGQPAGTVSVTRPRYASDFPRSLTAHDVGLRDLIEAASLVGGLPDVTLVTVSIAGMQSMTPGLSPAVEAAIPVVRHLVRRMVADESGVAHA